MNTSIQFSSSGAATAMTMAPFGFDGDKYNQIVSGGDQVLIASSVESSLSIGEEEAEQRLRFNQLVIEWKARARLLSSVDEIVELQPYQDIIDMGEAAVPLLLAQLKSEGANPHHWFYALRAVTGENPVSPDDRGRTKKMAAAWLEWGTKRNG